MAHINTKYSLIRRVQSAAIENSSRGRHYRDKKLSEVSRDPKESCGLNNGKTLP